MSEYTRWEMLNESLGFPLGVKSAASLGLAGGLQSIEEGKKKKKMDVDVELPDDEGDDEESDVMPPVGGDDAEGGCSCDHPAPKGDDAPMMCKKCNKKMKKGMKKKMKNEDRYSGYEQSLFQQMAEVGSQDYKNQFWASLNSHFSDPRSKNDGGVNLGEEVVFEPETDEVPAAKPGQPGFAPMNRVGGDQGTTPGITDWEKSWTQIAEAMQGLSAKVEAMSKARR